MKTNTPTTETETKTPAVETTEKPVGGVRLRAKLKAGVRKAGGHQQE